MHPLVGLQFSGATLTPNDDLAHGQGRLGQPVWGPAELLRDLELRLGLAAGDGTEADRVVAFAARVRALGNSERYYARSFEVDALGTAAALLNLRDSLVEAGWKGEAIAGAGTRFDCILELEHGAGPALPAAQADRVSALHRALDRHASLVYDGLTLAEPLECWPLGWRRVYEALRRLGTVTRSIEVSLPGAPPDTDLGMVQAALRADSKQEPVRLRGDGSLMLLRANTTIEAAEVTAAVLAALEPHSAVVVRDWDAAPLEYALQSAGLPRQGLRSTSTWRAPLQLLPLALELAFEPKDPYRVQELLSLPGGPFRGSVGRRLARALVRSPGIGGRAWEEAKERLTEPRDAALATIAEWLERAGADRQVGASNSDVVRVVERVRDVLLAQIAGSEDPIAMVGVANCDALKRALQQDGRDRWDLTSLRRLAELTASNAQVVLHEEQVGRVAHVDGPGTLWVSRPTVIWWGFVRSRTGGAGHTATPWREHELRAFARAGLQFPDKRAVLRERAQSWRRTIAAATERVVLVVPEVDGGQLLGVHPLWDEIEARLGLSDRERSRITQHTREMLAEHLPSSEPTIEAPALKLRKLAALPLPPALPEWQVELPEQPTWESHSASSLGSLLGCPLQWALANLGRLSSEGTRLAEGPLLIGSLGHRLIEELFEGGAFELEREPFLERADEVLRELVQSEASSLLRPGKAHERDQKVQQLIASSESLFRSLRDNGLKLVAVEQAFSAPWQGRTLVGRLDLVTRAASGRNVIIDVKYGRKRYSDALQSGTALQLATYVYALSLDEPDVTAAYFSLNGRRLVALPAAGLSGSQQVNGPDFEQTWRKLEKTLPLVHDVVGQGRFAATGVRRALPLLEGLGVAAAARSEHLEITAGKACEFCTFDALCGRRWEQQS